jgi:hypothetical protein
MRAVIIIRENEKKKLIKKKLLKMLGMKFPFMEFTRFLQWHLLNYN